MIILYNNTINSVAHNILTLPVTLYEFISETPDNKKFIKN